MAGKHLHIVCLDVPYPPDYGGVFDLFYKIVALYEQGIKIHLHCFEYGRGQQDELKKYCENVFYYKRKAALNGLLPGLPYIVSSRISGRLLANLEKDSYPVLLEGIHCTYYLYANRLSNRKVFVRLHNVEHTYYAQLAKAETSILKKLYLLRESRLLKKYEKTISSKAALIAVTLSDKEVYETLFSAGSIRYLPVFLPYSEVCGKEGKGDFCLYHGNLGVMENEKAAIWLLDIFAGLQMPLVIAGKNPSRRLIKAVDHNSNASLVSNPPATEMDRLVRDAQVNILPSFNATGIKIKLLHAAFNGRHCLVNPPAVAGTGLAPICHIARDSESFRKQLAELYDREFSNEDLVLRRQLLLPIYNNMQNSRQLIEWIY